MDTFTNFLLFYQYIYCVVPKKLTYFIFKLGQVAVCLRLVRLGAIF